MKAIFRASRIGRIILRYRLDDLRDVYRARIDASDLSSDDAARVAADLEAGLHAYTYLSDEPLG